MISIKTNKTHLLSILIITLVYSCSFNKFNSTVDEPKEEIVVDEDNVTNETELGDTLAETDHSENIIEYYNENVTDLLSVAQKSEKKIILFFGASWCKPCVKYKKETFLEEDNYNYLSTHYLIKYLDVDTDFEGLELKQTYNIVNLPTLVFINNSKNEIGRITGHLMGYSFLKKITEINAID